MNFKNITLNTLLLSSVLALHANQEAIAETNAITPTELTTAETKAIVATEEITKAADAPSAEETTKGAETPADKKALTSAELFKKAISDKDFNLETKSDEGLTAVLITLRGYILSPSAENQDIYLKAFAILLSRKNNHINAQDAENRTALYFLTVYTLYPEVFATTKDKKINLELIELFLQHGANPLITDTKGVTPLHFAVEKGDMDILTMFEKYQWIKFVEITDETVNATDEPDFLVRDIAADSKTSEAHVAEDSKTE